MNTNGAACDSARIEYNAPPSAGPAMDAPFVRTWSWARATVSCSPGTTAYNSSIRAGLQVPWPMPSRAPATSSSGSDSQPVISATTTRAVTSARQVSVTRTIWRGSKRSAGERRQPGGEHRECLHGREQPSPGRGAGQDQDDQRIGDVSDRHAERRSGHPDPQGLEAQVPPQRRRRGRRLIRSGGAHLGHFRIPVRLRFDTAFKW